MDVCLHCSAPIPHSTTGRPRSYCSTRCRVAAHRARRGLTCELQRLDTPPAPPDTSAPVVITAYSKPGPFESQVVGFVQEARRVAAQGDRLARGPVPQLAARCKITAAGIFDALERGFPGSGSW